MTLIMACREEGAVTIVADRLGQAGGIKSDDRKIGLLKDIRGRHLAFATSGSTDRGIECVRRAIQGESVSWADDGAVFIMSGVIFEGGGEGFVPIYDDFSAMGYSRLATGLYAVGKKPHEIFEIAEEISTGVSAEFDQVTISDSGKIVQSTVPVLELKEFDFSHSSFWFVAQLATKKEVA